MIESYHTFYALTIPPPDNCPPPNLFALLPVYNHLSAGSHQLSPIVYVQDGYILASAVLLSLDNECHLERLFLYDSSNGLREEVVDDIINRASSRRFTKIVCQIFDHKDVIYFPSTESIVGGFILHDEMDLLLNRGFKESGIRRIYQVDLSTHQNGSKKEIVFLPKENELELLKKMQIYVPYSIYCPILNNSVLRSAIGNSYYAFFKNVFELLTNERVEEFEKPSATAQFNKDSLEHNYKSGKLVPLLNENESLIPTILRLQSALSIDSIQIGNISSPDLWATLESELHADLIAEIYQLTLPL